MDGVEVYIHTNDLRDDGGVSRKRGDSSRSSRERPQKRWVRIQLERQKRAPEKAQNIV